MTSISRRAAAPRRQAVARLGAAIAAAALVGCADPAPRAVTTPEAQRGPRGPVVVTLVVDQLAAWIAADRFPLLPDDGGFARLRREGTWARDARHAHAVTDTAPGHAALYTGAPPRDSGIFANERFDAATRVAVSILRDDAVVVVAPEGVTREPGSSIAALRVETLADRVRAEQPDATIVSLSLKDRGAIFAAGRRPTAAIWFDPSRDTFVTSSAYASAIPGWARAIVAPSALAKARATPWRPLDEGWIRAHATTPDAQPGEGDLDGFGTVFPHDFARAQHPAIAFRASPYGDETLLSLGLSALDASPAGRAPTLLAISLSSHDYVAHVFGPESWEAWDELRRLDAALGRFFRGLDARFGERGWAALLTADHGSSPLPETAAVPGARPWCKPGARDRWDRPCAVGGRLFVDRMASDLAAAAAAAIGQGDWVLGVAEPWVHLTAAARALDGARREALQRALIARLMAYPEVERVFDVRALPGRCPPPSDDSEDALVCRSCPSGAGDLYVVTRAGSLFDPTYTPGAGAAHGSPRIHDRAVPLLVRAPGRVAAGREIDAPLPAGAFTRTAASLLGVTPPAAAAAAPDLAGSR